MNMACRTGRLVACSSRAANHTRESARTAEVARPRVPRGVFGLLVFAVSACGATVVLAQYGDTYWVPFRSQSTGPAGTENLVVATSFSDGNQVGFDYENDGIMDLELTLGTGESFCDTHVVEGERIVSTDRLQLHYQHDLEDRDVYEDGSLRYDLLPERYFGTDYWISLDASRLSILSAEDGNVVYVDQDHDGTPEETYSLGHGDCAYLMALAGAHVWGAKPFWVLAVNETRNGYEKTYAYEVWPTSLLGTRYYAPHEHQYVFDDPTCFSGVHVVATEDETTVLVGGDSHELDAGMVLYVASADEVSIVADKKIFAVRHSRIEATDFPHGRRDYEYAYPLIPDSYGLWSVIATDGFRAGLGWPVNELSVVSLGDGNPVSFDVGLDGAIEYIEILSEGAFFYLHELDGWLQGWHTEPLLIQAQAPIQCVHTVRNWWYGTCEGAGARALVSGGGEPGSAEGQTSSAQQLRILDTYPNPSSCTTTVAFSLTRPGWVSCGVYDFLGRKVAHVFNGHLARGSHFCTWNAAGIGPGVYHCRLASNQEVAVTKCVVLR